MRILPGLAAFVTATAMAQTPAVRPVFDVASIKLNNSPGSRVWLAPPVGDTFTATNVTPRMLISLAWGVANYEYAGGPAWLEAERYDVIAKTPDASRDTDRFLAMLRTLLEDRFQLRSHRETRELPGYALKVSKAGLRLPDAHPEGCATFAARKAAPSAQLESCEGMMVTPGLISNKRISMAWFTGVISNVLDRPVIDETGYTGSFAVHLEFAPLNDDGSTDSTRPSVFTALQEQLGLKLESQKGPAEVLVIDHAEKLSDN